MSIRFLRVPIWMAASFAASAAANLQSTSKARTILHSKDSSTLKCSNWRQPKVGFLGRTTRAQCHFVARSHLGLKNPGVLLALQSADVARVIESLLIIWSISREEEWIDQIHYLPSLSRHVFR